VKWFSGSPATAQCVHNRLRLDTRPLGDNPWFLVAPDARPFASVQTPPIRMAYCDLLFKQPN